jgi:Ca2+-binding RTX toxin-like protein
MSRTAARRTAAGLAVAAAVTGAVVIGAPAAQAAPAPVLTVEKPSTSEVFVKGTTKADGVTVSLSGSTLSFASTLGAIQAGPGCWSAGGSVVRCSTGLRIIFEGFDGDDSFRNNTSVRSTLDGFGGDDRLSGGSRDDIIRGGAGQDFAFGGAGVDSCTAEQESGCET